MLPPTFRTATNSRAYRKARCPTGSSTTAKSTQIWNRTIGSTCPRNNLRKDSHSRGITGSSSGGICAFNAAWFHNELFSRVVSRIGSFTSIQWHPGEIEGGNIYPFKIRKEAKRNIRVWLQDGAND